MNRLPTVARLLLGLIFFVFGLNGFLNFLPPPEVPEAGGRFIGALIDSGYLWTLVNIVLFHLFLAPGVAALAVPLLVLALEIYLARAYASSFRGVLDGTAQPG